MPKRNTRYVCQQCGAESAQWFGQCRECAEWNTLQEEVITVAAPAAQRPSAWSGSAAPAPLNQVREDDYPRLLTGIGEIDRVLGGGVVQGSVILLGGDPGVGKSTLLTQVADRLSNEGSVLYVSGEESAHQVKLRAKRLGAAGATLYVLAETALESIVEQIEQLHPQVAIIDSIQTTRTAELESAPGSVAQVRACGNMLQRVAKERGVAIFIVGHVTKEGALAGPRALEHMVDTVLTFEGDRQLNYRVLRATKNRFGSTDELALFEMRDNGLYAVDNPSEWLLAERAVQSPGSVVTCIMEGSRPLLIEVQALVCRSYLSQPRRQVTGMDTNRVNMILAVLEKRAGMRLSDRDIFVNVAGGIQVREPAGDLAVALAVASSTLEITVPPDLAAIGEVGLAGEVRGVSHASARVREVARLGFTQVLLARRDTREASAAAASVSLNGIAWVGDAVAHLRPAAG